MLFKSASKTAHQESTFFYFAYTLACRLPILLLYRLLNVTLQTVRVGLDESFQDFDSPNIASNFRTIPSLGNTLQLETANSNLERLRTQVYRDMSPQNTQFESPVSFILPIETSSSQQDVEENRGRIIKEARFAVFRTDRLFHRERESDNRIGVSSMIVDVDVGQNGTYRLPDGDYAIMNFTTPEVSPHD